MAELVSVDRAGRVVIPKAIRDALGIDERTQLLVAAGEHGRLVLQKVDVEALAGQLEKELAGTDVEAVVRKVRKEMRSLVRRRYPDLLA
ncbi:MAG TPA: AbrB/MazE/SpoVT family DNA-binding domain-containing protein [Thermoplasmata archaeon]|nr:AbrB/MazE/SpoVT family DNA-binding domain-containing protein [Thermoplasmata archaeon]